MISFWEKGKSTPDRGQRRKLESVLGFLSNLKGKNGSAADTLGLGALGAWLSRERAKKGMSVPELAKKSGLSSVAIYNIESGKSVNPQKETRSRLSDALGATIPLEIEQEVAEEQELGDIGTLIDFDPHDEEALPAVAGVYVFYDVSERPIYVGKAENIAKRVSDHSEKFWFKRPIVNNASYVEIHDAQLRHSIEQVLIKFLKSNAVINKQSVDR